MPIALLGYTGFVGSTLLRQTQFDDTYNSKNISALRGRAYDLIVCAAAPAAKYVANQNPEADRQNLAGLMDAVSNVQAERFVLISTVDVYRMPPAVYEDTPVEVERADAYGRHRYELEEFVRGRFANAVVIRLPGLFGEGLKKNFIFDMIHRGASEWTHAESVFQFYDMSRLWADIQLVLRAEPVPALINFATEPVKAKDIAAQVFGIEYNHHTPNPPVNYDMRTRYAGLWGKSGDYIASQSEVSDQICVFVAAQRGLGS